MSGDVPRAHFTNIVVSEIIAPLFYVALTLIPYLFINAQTGVLPQNNGNKKVTATASLIRVGAVALAPIAINAGVAGMFFAMACCMGPLLSMCCKKFGSVLAAVAHCIAVIMMLVAFEAMFVLEGFSFERTLLGMISAIAIQRFLLKLIIALALTREFKTDSANIAWWTGKWYNMGWHSLSQPGREFLCKITELTMFAGDFVLGHFILFIMLPVLVIPYVDTFHSVMLFWLRPSKQIRPPIYSLKQSKLRKRRVIRFAMLYFFLFVIFMAMIIGPVVAGKMKSIQGIGSTLQKSLPSMPVFQPAVQNNNDTRGYTKTGTGLVAGQGTVQIGGTGAAATGGGAASTSVDIVGRR